MKTACVTVLIAASTSLLALTANAADLIEPPTPVIVEEPFSWTRPFGGLFGGVAFSNSDFDVDYDGIVDGSASFDSDDVGVFGGAQLGFDYEFNNFVVGAVADIALTTIETSASGTVAGLGGVEASSEINYLGTIRGRLGYAAFDRLLLYGHGGFAYAGVDRSIDVTGVGSIGGDDETKTGYVVGAGLEYAITNNLSIQAEYGYYDLGSDEVFSGPVLGNDNLEIDEDLDFHAVKAAINYRF